MPSHPSPLAPAALVAILATGCAVPPAPRPELPEIDWPMPPRATADARVYRIDRAASEIRIRVDPAGPMARFGHSHVVGGAIVEGCVIDAPGDQRDALELSIDVTAIEVDRPEWRRAAGLDPQLDADAVAGTRANLLGPRVLDAQHFPVIAVRSLTIAGAPGDFSAALAVRLRDQIRRIDVPVRADIEGERLTAEAAFGFNHADFGLEPFSAAGGALSVAQPIRVQIRLVANATGPAGLAIIDDPAAQRPPSPTAAVCPPT